MALNFGIFGNRGADGSSSLLFGGNSYPGYPSSSGLVGFFGVFSGAWNAIGNIQDSDNSYADQQISANPGTITLKEIKFYDYSTSTWHSHVPDDLSVPTSDDVSIYGGPNFMFGIQMTPSLLNKTTNSIVANYEISGVAESGEAGGQLSNPKIPKGAIVSGMEIVIEHYADNSGPSIIYMDSMHVRFYYSVVD